MSNIIEYKRDGMPHVITHYVEMSTDKILIRQYRTVGFDDAMHIMEEWAREIAIKEAEKTQ